MISAFWRVIHVECVATNRVIELEVYFDLSLQSFITCEVSVLARCAGWTSPRRCIWISRAFYCYKWWWLHDLRLQRPPQRIKVWKLKSTTYSSLKSLLGRFGPFFSSRNFICIFVRYINHSCPYHLCRKNWLDCSPIPDLVIFRSGSQLVHVIVTEWKWTSNQLYWIEDLENKK